MKPTFETYTIVSQHLQQRFNLPESVKYLPGPSKYNSNEFAENPYLKNEMNPYLEECSREEFIASLFKNEK